jgi:HTH-type transcriptional regulator / antitoxin HipB
VSALDDSKLVSTYGDMLYLSSNADTADAMRVSSINDLSAVIRGRRVAAGLTQAEAAAAAGVSRQWLNELEHGKPTAELGLVLAVLEALGLMLELDDEQRPSSSSSSSTDLDALLEEHRDR